MGLNPGLVRGEGYIALVGNVVRPRMASDRSGLQARLLAGIQAVNDRFAEGIAARFTLTVGDEFQGLLSGARDVDRILGTLRIHTYPDELCFGLGIGRLDTPLQAQALGMDGPCFHHARTAVQRAAERMTPVEVEAASGRPAFDIYALLYGSLRRGLTDRQRQVADLALAGLEGVDIARRLSISPSAVSQHLRAAGGRALSEATRAWMRALQLALLEAG